VLNKTDIVTREEAIAVQHQMPGKIFPISAVTGEGVREFLEAAWKVVEEARIRDGAQV